MNLKRLWHLKTTTAPVITGNWQWSRKGQINALTRYLAVPSYMKQKKLHFAEIGEHYQGDWKNITQNR